MMKLQIGVKTLLIALAGVLVSVVSKFLITPYDHLVSAAGHVILAIFWLVILVQHCNQKKRTG